MLRVLFSAVCGVVVFGLFPANMAGADEESASSRGASVWSQFRGANASGIAPEQTVPLHFGPQHNVRWKTPLLPGASSPCNE